MLYDYIKQRGSELSVIRLSSKSNQREEIMSYMKTTYPDGKPRGVVFILDGNTYADLENDYRASDRHANLNISDSNILIVCDAIANTGELFSY